MSSGSNGYLARLVIKTLTPPPKGNYRAKKVVCWDPPPLMVTGGPSILLEVVVVVVEVMVVLVSTMQTIAIRAFQKYLEIHMELCRVSNAIIIAYYRRYCGKLPF
jgi:hypothetical protein